MERVVLGAVLAEGVVAPLTVHGLLWDPVEGHGGTTDAATLQQVAHPGDGMAGTICWKEMEMFQT